MITLEQAKSFLRVDFEDEDQLILSLIKASETLVKDILRDDVKENDLTRLATLYSVAYLYENRENPNYKTLTKTLRALLFGARREVF